VAVCTALLEQPAAFTVVDALPEPPTRKTAGRSPRRAAAAKTEPAELRAAGLQVLDRLLVELAEGGLVQLGPEKAALIEQCAELVRALKLRRLGNLLMQLQRAVADPRLLAASDPTGGSAFARLLVDLYLCRAATGAALAGASELDSRLAEDLVGKTWRAEELEAVSGLELMQVAATREDDGDFVVETSYLVDLASREIFAERQITPSRLRSAPKPQHRLRLLVDEAGLYPELPPRRIRLSRFRRAALRVEDVERLVAGATDDVTEIQRRLVARASVPVGRPEVAVLFRPSAILTPPEAAAPTGAAARRPVRTSAIATFGAEDASGRFVAASMAGVSAETLAAVLPAERPCALFGLATLGDAGLTLRCLAVIGATAGETTQLAFGGIFAPS
jgi:hypothetical protein